MCIVPNNRKDRYDAIKKLCCVEKPVPSQVVVGRTLSKKQMLMSVCTKIGIQLNCKLGGEVWAVEIPVSNMMVVGFDVYHDSASKGKSVGGFIASTNKHLTKYYSRITQQQSHQEIADQLRVCMTGNLYWSPLGKGVCQRDDFTENWLNLKQNLETTSRLTWTHRERAMFQGESTLLHIVCMVKLFEVVHILWPRKFSFNF